GGLFGGGQLRCQRKVADGPAQRIHYHVHGVPLTGAGVADIEAFALEVLDVLDVGIGAGDDCQRLAVQRKHGAHVSEGAGIGKVLHALIGLVLDIRLDHTHVHLASADGIHVGDRAAAGRRITADVVIAGAAVDQPAQRLPDYVIDTCLAACTDGDEVLLGDGRSGSDRSASDCSGKEKGEGFDTHTGAPCSCQATV